MFPRTPLLTSLPQIGALLLFAASKAHGQAPPKLDSLQATWFQRGTTNEVTLNGDSLAGAGTVQFSAEGVQGEIFVQGSTNVTLEASGAGLAATAPANAKMARLRLIVRSNAGLGPRELRVLGPGGISNPLTVHVSDLPEILESNANATQATAQSIALPVGVSGVIDKPAVSDWYKFHAKPGEKLIFDVQANRNGSPLDPTLVLWDAAGKEVARSEDAHGLDPWLEFTPTAEGDFYLQLHDLRFQGGGDYRYRLVAGALPYLDQLFPFGGRRGSAVELSLKGRNLDGVNRMTLNIARDATLGRQEIRATTPRGHSNPLGFEASDLPDLFEAEPNNETAKANAFTPPVAIHGRIGDKGDVDVYRFKATADQRLVAEARARSFGSPLDALLVLMDASGKVLQQNDDASGLDARIEFDAKKDVEYLLQLRDLTDRGGELFGYRLTVQPPVATVDFALRASAARIRVQREGITAIRCDLERRNGFAGVVRVQARPLPVGVESSTLVLSPDGPQFGWILIDATAKAELATGPWQLEATSEIQGTTVTKAGSFPESPFVSVLPAAVFAIDSLTPALQLEQNADATIEVAVQRFNGFAGDIKIVAEDLPGISFPATTLQGTQTRAKITVHAAYNAETGTRPLVLRGEAQVSGQPQVQHGSSVIPVTVTGIPFFITSMLPGSPFFRTDPVKLAAVALPTNAVSAANSSEFVVKVERRNFTNDIQIALEGVPEGVIATTAPLANNARETTIRLLVSDRTPVGTNFTLNVVGSALVGDRTFKQRTVPVTLSVTAREAETAAAAPTAPSNGATPSK